LGLVVARCTPQRITAKRALIPPTLCCSARPADAIEMGARGLDELNSEKEVAQYLRAHFVKKVLARAAAPASSPLFAPRRTKMRTT
jgi:hypothetical protein